jgi:hypothetical protein
MTPFGSMIVNPLVLAVTSDQGAMFAMISDQIREQLLL